MGTKGTVGGGQMPFRRRATWGQRASPRRTQPPKKTAISSPGTYTMYWGARYLKVHVQTTGAVGDREGAFTRHPCAGEDRLGTPCLWCFQGHELSQNVPWGIKRSTPLEANHKLSDPSFLKNGRGKIRIRGPLARSQPTSDQTLLLQ